MSYISQMFIDIFEKKGMNFDEINYQEIEKMYLVQGKNENYFYIFIELDIKKIKEFLVSFQPHIYSFFYEEYMKNESNKIKLTKGFEKNSTIILCTVNDNYSKEIENIEEDPYFFKKQVLRLNKIECDYIKNEIMEGEYLNTIEKIIFDKDLFSSFLIEDNFKYSLATKLYEKIPFLELNTIMVQRKDLDHIIEDSILNLSEDHLKLRDFILKIEDKNFDEIINSKEFV